MADVAVTTQIDRAVDLVFAEQIARGTLAPAANGVRFPFQSYNKIAYDQTRIGDPRNRKNGMTGASKLGRTNYGMSGVRGPLMVNAYDLLLQGAQRESFVAAATKTQADISQLQSMTTGGLATFTASPITAGVRVGQWHQWASGLAVADRGKPLLVLGVTATTIQYALPRHGNFTAVAAATDFSFDIKKNLQNAAERWPFTIEDRSENRDFSEVTDFALIRQMVLSGQGQAPVNLTFDFLAAEVSKVQDASSPYFTTVANPTGEFLCTPEVRINVNGVWVNYDEFAITWDLSSFADETNALKAIDIAHGSSVISASVTILDDQVAEDTFDAALADTNGFFAVEGIDAAGKFIGFSLPLVKFTQPSGSSKGEDRFSTRSFQIEASEDTRGGAFVNTMCLVSSDT